MLLPQALLKKPFTVVACLIEQDGLQRRGLSWTRAAGRQHPGGQEIDTAADNLFGFQRGKQNLSKSPSVMGRRGNSSPGN